MEHNAFPSQVRVPLISAKVKDMADANDPRAHKRRTESEDLNAFIPGFIGFLMFKDLMGPGS